MALHSFYRLHTIRKFNIELGAKPAITEMSNVSFGSSQNFTPDNII